MVSEKSVLIFLFCKLFLVCVEGGFVGSKCLLGYLYSVIWCSVIYFVLDNKCKEVGW